MADPLTLKNKNQNPQIPKKNNGPKTGPLNKRQIPFHHQKDRHLSASHKLQHLSHTNHNLFPAPMLTFMIIISLLFLIILFFKITVQFYLKMFFILFCFLGASFMSSVLLNFMSCRISHCLGLADYISKVYFNMYLSAVFL